MGRPHFRTRPGETPRPRRPLSLGPAWACSCQLWLRVPCRNAHVRLQSSSCAPAGATVRARWTPRSDTLRCAALGERDSAAVSRAAALTAFSAEAAGAASTVAKPPLLVEGEKPRYPPPRCGGKRARTSSEVPCKPRNFHRGGRAAAGLIFAWLLTRLAGPAFKK